MALLFQDGDFVSHAGLPLAWKIECDAITDDEWRCLAKMIMGYQTKPFSKVVGIPRGGKKLEDALQPYCDTRTFNDHIGDIVNYPVLIVDDVYTTGTSFREFREEHYLQQEVYQWCVFARRQPEDGVKALFTMP